MLKRSRSSGIMLNTKAIVACVVSVGVCVYLIYSWASSRSELRSGTHLRHLSTWKTADFVDIPPNVLDASKKIKIQEKYVKVKVGEQTLNIFFREAEGQSKRPSVLMLHGASSSSEVWQKIGTMQLIAAMGHNAFAVDLPGWAKSKETQQQEELYDVFLKALLSAMSLSQPMVISASMSGRYVLPFLMQPDPTDCDERMSAFVPLAPVYTQAFSHAEYHRCEIPTMIVYGTKDKSLGLTSVGNLRNMPGSEIMPMEDAGHANYEERPDEWHRLLYNFILAVEKRIK